MKEITLIKTVYNNSDDRFERVDHGLGQKQQYKNYEYKNKTTLNRLFVRSFRQNCESCFILQN